MTHAPPTVVGRVRAVLTGRARPYTRPGFLSAARPSEGATAPSGGSATGTAVERGGYMSAARPSEGATAPSGGSATGTAVERGGDMSAARPSEGARAPSGGSATGTAVERGGFMSGIDKRPLAGAVAVGAEGLHGDEQGDTRVHGGPDKAVHVYPWAHYAVWQLELGARPLLEAPGAFGENLSVDGLDEHSVCLGDAWSIGSARFVVSQGRQPCWKLSDRFGVPDMARRVQASGRTGWYLRVLGTGSVSAGDAVLLAHRPHPGWPLARIAALIDQRVCEPSALRELLALPLPPSWRRLFERRLTQGLAEDWSARLEGQAPQ